MYVFDKEVDIEIHLDVVVVDFSQVFDLAVIAGEAFPIVGLDNLVQLTPTQVSLDALLTKDVRAPAKR